MATEAEIDLIVNATQTLSTVERDLDRIVTAAQGSVDDIEVAAVLDQTTSLRQVDRALSGVVASASASGDDVTVRAALDQQTSLRQVVAGLDRMVDAIESSGTADQVSVSATLNSAASVRHIRSQLNAVVELAEALAPEIEVGVDVDADSVRTLGERLRAVSERAGRFGNVLGGASSALGRFGGTATAAGSAVGALPNLLAGAVASLQQIGPAAAVGVQGFLALQLASGTLKLGLMGVEDALTAAFDPDTKPEDLAEAMGKLAPEARKAVAELVKLKDTFKDIQLGVQNRLFADADAAVRRLATSALPSLGIALDRTADILNRMGREVVSVADHLATSGTLGRALDGATKGLENLSKVPAQLILAFGQLGAAAAPAFDRITSKVAEVATTVSERLTGAFASGALEDAINGAVDAVAQLGRVARNVFTVLGNVIKTATGDGDGLFTVLENITGALAEVSGSEGFQEALSSLSRLMSRLATAVIPVFTGALAIVGDIVTELSPIVGDLVTRLGDNLSRVLTAARPAFQSLSVAVGELLAALSPLIDLAGDLLVAILPALIPLFDTFAGIIAEAAPVLRQLAENLSVQLVPAFNALGVLLAELGPVFLQLAAEILPQVTETLQEMEPQLVEIATSLADIVVQLTPLIASFLQLALQIETKVMPVIGPVLVGALILVSDTLKLVASAIQQFVVPAVRTIANLLQGDFRGAIASAQVFLSNLRTSFDTTSSRIRTAAANLASGLVTSLTNAARNARDGFLRGVNDLANRAIVALQNLNTRVRSVFGGLPGAMFTIGVNIITGLINGIRSKIGSLISAASDAASAVTGKIAHLLGIHSPSVVAFGFGDNFVQGFINAVQSRLEDLRSSATSMVAAVTGPSSLATVSAPAVSVAAPVVMVQIGNRAITDFITVQTNAALAQSARTTSQGVRR